MDYTLLVKYYAKVYADKHGINFHEVLRGVAPLLGKIGLEKISANVKFDLSDEDIKVYYDMIKETFGDEFVIGLNVFNELIHERVHHYIDHLRRKGKYVAEVINVPKKEVQETKNEESKVEEKPKVEEPKGEKPKEEKPKIEDKPKVEEKAKVEEKPKAVEKPSKKLTVEFIDEMKNQQRSERALFRKMREKKEDIKESVSAKKKSEQAQAEVSQPAPAFNWEFVLMFAGVAIVVGLIYFFITNKKPVTVKSETIQQQPTVVEQPPVQSKPAVISASELLSKMGG